ncbi:acyltransferase family protein [Enterococcus sp. LJL51]|uniref:acyltransferase family protein n=1 Tax=Enterococcus sp. LJL51 TaxID=3416656 RepID=UPI003CF93A46
MNTQRRILTLNFTGIDLVKYAAAIMIICIHCDAVVDSPLYNFIIKNIICRLAVPYFFITAGFFVRKGMTKSEGYLQRYLLTMGKSYLLWSLLFLPLGLQWISQQFDLPILLYPVALLVGLIYVGTYYHLWYIPATMFALVLTHFLLKRLGYVKLLGFSIVLYSLGCLESYSGLLNGTMLGDLFKLYQQFFITTRNGLFFGFVFIVLGFLLHDYGNKLAVIQLYSGRLLILLSIISLLEGMLLFFNPGTDANFLFSQLLFSPVFFLWTLSLRVPKNWNYRQLRELSKYYYFLHPLVLFFSQLLLAQLSVQWLLPTGLLQFLLVVSVTHLLSTGIISITGKLRARKNAPAIKPQHVQN